MPFITWKYRRNTTAEPVVLSANNRTVISQYDILIEDASGSAVQDIEMFMDELISDPMDSKPALMNVTSYLIIYELVFSDEGYYSCSAENSVPNSVSFTNTSEAYVIVQSKPDQSYIAVC